MQEILEIPKIRAELHPNHQIKFIRFLFHICFGVPRKINKRELVGAVGKSRGPSAGVNPEGTAGLPGGFQLVPPREARWLTGVVAKRRSGLASPGP